MSGTNGSSSKSGITIPVKDEAHPLTASVRPARGHPSWRPVHRRMRSSFFLYVESPGVVCPEQDLLRVPGTASRPELSDAGKQDAGRRESLLAVAESRVVTTTVVPMAFAEEFGVLQSIVPLWMDRTCLGSGRPAAEGIGRYPGDVRWAKRRSH